jgi:hypothetical protein
MAATEEESRRAVALGMGNLALCFVGYDDA